MNYHLELVIKKFNTTNINDFQLNISSHYINTTNGTHTKINIKTDYHILVHNIAKILPRDRN
jgi:hypothetical protein